MCMGLSGTEMLAVFMILSVIVAFFAIRGACHDHGPESVRERFDQAAYTTDIRGIKSDVARLALAVKEQGDFAKITSSNSAPSIDVTSALTNAKAAMGDQVKLVADDLGALKSAFGPLQHTVGDQTTELDALQKQVLAVNNSMISDADKVALLAALEAVKKDVINLQISDTALSSKIDNITTALTGIEASLVAYSDAARTAQAATAAKLTGMDVTYQQQFTDMMASISNIQNVDIKNLQTFAANAQSVNASLLDIRSSFGGNGAFTLSAANGFLGLDAARGRVYGSQATSIGQAADATGAGFVADVVVAGDGSNGYHALAFGGSLTDPAASTVIAEHQLADGTSEMLLAKYGQNRGSTIRSHAAAHVFSVPTGFTTVPASAADAIAMSGGAKAVMQVTDAGVTIGDYMLKPQNDGLYVCDKAGAACSKL